MFYDYFYYIYIFGLTSCGSEFGTITNDKENTLTESEITETDENTDNADDSADDTDDSTDNTDNTTDNTEPPRVVWCENDGSFFSIHTDKSDKKTVLTSIETPIDIVFDSQENQLIWAVNTRQVMGSNIDIVDQNIYLTISGIKIHGPTALGIDTVNNYIFWNRYDANTTTGNNEIFKESLSEAIYTGDIWITESTNEYKYVYSICIDSTSSKIYYTSNSYYNSSATYGNGNTGGVYIAELGTSKTATQILSSKGPAAPSTPFKGIAVDSAKGYIYYVSNSESSLDIIRTDLTLANPQNWIHANAFDIAKIALDLTGRKIYWTDQTAKRIYRAELDVKETDIEIFLNLNNQPNGITIIPPK